MIIGKMEMQACLSGKTGNPHGFLGLHSLGSGKGMVARCLDPGADSVSLLDLRSQTEHSMERLDPSGFFELSLPSDHERFAYLLVSRRGEVSCKWEDPYRFLPVIGNEELRGFNEGWDRRPFEKLGSVPRKVDGVDGVSFVVWAPSAQSVHLTGDFNGWSTISLPMRALGSSGCRELFVPQAKTGQKYKYRVLGLDGTLREKADPFAFRCESPPGNASIIHARNESGPGSGSLSPIHPLNPREEPLSIYEMHLGSWRFDEKEKAAITKKVMEDTVKIVDHVFGEEIASQKKFGAQMWSGLPQFLLDSIKDRGLGGDYNIDDIKKMIKKGAWSIGGNHPRKDKLLTFAHFEMATLKYQAKAIKAVSTRKANCWQRLFFDMHKLYEK